MTDRPKLLDLFCCAGGASYGYYMAGFDVTGVDIKPQPHYPFRFIQADALDVDLSGYDAYHASPPCQAYSMAFSPLVGYRKDHPKLIEPVREMLDRTGKPYVLENVPRSPLRKYIKLNGTMFGLKTKKERLFELHRFEILMLPAPFENTRGMVKNGKLVGIVGHFKSCPNEIIANRENLAAAYKIDWFMNRHELRQAIPPAYTEFIGRHLMKTVLENS